MKLRDAISIKRVSQVCYREIKYKKDDPLRQCHLKFTEIHDVCYHCKWFVANMERSLVCLGEDIPKLIEFIHQYAPQSLDRHKNIDVEKIADKNKNILDLPDNNT